MSSLSVWTLLASLTLPLLPQGVAILLLRRAWRSEQPHYLCLAAAGMVQVLSTLWLLKSFTKLPLFFDAVLTPAYDQWAAVTLDAGPYLAVSMTLLVGVFHAGLAWAGRRRKPKVGAATVTEPKPFAPFSPKRRTKSKR